MAYASVASLLETIDLVNYHGDSSISSRFKDQITSLHKHTTFLQSFLEDGDPNRVKNWEETIRDVADRAEEIIDILVSDSLLKLSAGSKSELGYSFDELEKVTKEMESTVDRVKGRRSNKAKAGSDVELMKIVSLLCEGLPNLEAISIVGMGGMGKSTLARNAYNHPLVTEHFDVRACSTVGQEYSRSRIILDLLRCMKIESVSDLGDEAMESLFTSLVGRRYLIVLHGIWSIDAWDDMRRAFPDNGNGSRIILTTRLLDLARSAGHVREISLLDEDQSWNLLREKIFKGDPCPSQLEHYGKIISNCCSGFQPTIEMVSGILIADQTEAAWEDFSENIKIAYELEYRILQVLSLGYTYLPHHLRPCFLYLGCLSEDHEVSVSKLLKMWVAEGFLTQSETKSFEEIGEEHVEFLVRRGLVLVSKRKSNGRIKSITVHGLVREVCLREAHMSNFFCDVGGFRSFQQQSTAGEIQSRRRVSGSNYGHDFLEGVHASTIRTAILYNIEEGVRWSIGNVRLLRIMDLSGSYAYDLPEEVFELFHLRYLAFHSGFSISEAISNLQNLQTLIIYPRENGRVFDTLLEGIWRMPQLRHLLGFGFILPTLKQGESENSALENLETLSRVVDFVCSKENLKMIPNVKKLNVRYTMSFKDVVEVTELRNLTSLHKLEILKIEMDNSLGEEHRMRCATFPPTLKKLNLCGLHLPWEDMKIVASLPNLEVLKLRNRACIGDTWETSEGGFQRLKYLLLEESNLENWMTETSHFPRLESLVLRSCLHLSKVPREIGEIPSLSVIELNGENQPLVLSARQIRDDRRNSGNRDSLLVFVV